MSAGSLAHVADRPRDLVIDRGGSVSAIAEAQRRAETILQVMANVMKEGQDYGKIPGTDKPSLFKPGAEKLMLTFQLAAAEPRVEDLSTHDEIRYRVHVPIQAPDGRVLAVGIGEASTNEEKYRWRKPVCDEEYDETPIDQRREKWFKGQNKPYKGKQIRTSPADLANTVLKMAHKRGFIHGTLLATGASSVFNQDLEDFTKELRDSLIEGDDDTTPKTAGKEPQRKSSSTSAGNASSSTKSTAPTADLLFVVGLVDKVWRPKDKKYFGIKLKGDDRMFTEWIDKGEQLEQDAKAFLGTDHQVKLGYVETVNKGTTYYNAKSIAVHDELPKGASTGTAADTSTAAPLTADEIFGGPRDPGQEG